MKKSGTINLDLELLRGVAIVFTLCSHLVWGLLPKMGDVGRQLQTMLQFWTGVDLFFCISGFIITTSLLKILEDKRADRGPPATNRWSQFIQLSIPFWIRRAFRLLPSAWLWILLTLILATTFNAHATFGTLRDNLYEAGAAVLNVANFYYYDTFANSNGVYGSFGIFWSLSLEEQFYLLLPFLLFFLKRRTFIFVLCAAWLAQFLVARPNGFTPHHTSLLWFIRTDALILGVFIALWKKSRTYRLCEPQFLRQNIFSLPLVGLCLLLLVSLPAMSAYISITTGLTAIVCGLLVFIASYDRDYILRPSMLKTAIVWLGSRSYSIYLIHVTGHTFVIELKRSAEIAEGSPLSVALTFLSVPFILILSELNYRFVETPFRRIGKRIAEKFGRHLSPSEIPGDLTLIGRAEPAPKSSKG
ncbi:MAG: acyltransferase [Nibricoccus sp.]